MSPAVPMRVPLACTHAVFRILVDDVAKERPDRLTIPEFLKTYRTFPPSRTYFTVTYRWDQFF